LGLSASGSASGAVELFPGFTVPAGDFGRQYPHLTVDERLLASFREEPLDTLTAASLLDRAVNNTSVMFLLQVGDALLLFPGDAQWGAWRPLLDDSDVRSLLTRTTLYKISHHGSHNGTPVEVAREVLGGVTSLLSVRPIERWAHIPKEELVESLVAPPRNVVSSVFAVDDPAVTGVRCHPAGLWKEVELTT